MYREFVEAKNYSVESQRCIEQTVEKLLNTDATINSPGMLLGKIQSGKTKTFIGIILLAFENGYDACFILTKGTKALATQTISRIENDFRIFIDDDIIKVYDIMAIPKLTSYILQQKLVFIIKKETNNLDRLDRLVGLFETYPDLRKKKVLIIDDEADFAGVGFKQDKQSVAGITQTILADKINNIRFGLQCKYSFLQVTATPYSLYLQPRGEIQVNGDTISPIRPAFTTLVPTYDGYIGGCEYFEKSQNQNSIFSHLYIMVPEQEVKVLNKPDRRYIANILTSPNINVFRTSIINFLVAGSIRMLQERECNRRYKCSFIIHTSTQRELHQWQIDLLESMLENLSAAANEKDEQFNAKIYQSYRQFCASIDLDSGHIPKYEDVIEEVYLSLIKHYVGVIRVNSEDQISTLLDSRGQLRLDNPFNIFVGGQILDRGLTIDNLLGFFYGRNPKVFQQDTVLQHSRMYGSRSMKDMAVTRLYTSQRIYNALAAMHNFDSALRDAFERGINQQDDDVVFVDVHERGEIRPCAPNKILITSTTTIKPHSRFVPYGFQTKSKTRIEPITNRISGLILNCNINLPDAPFTIPIETANKIIDLIDETFEFENKELRWNPNTYKAILKRLQEDILDESLKGKIYCYVQENRNISRLKDNGLTISDAPDDGNTDTRIAKEVAQQTACLILLKQRGLKEKGWRDAEFWWPVLITPANSRPAVFASEIQN